MREERAHDLRENGSGGEYQDEDSAAVAESVNAALDVCAAH